MNVCAKCGTPLADGVVSCPACGGLPVGRIPEPGAGQRLATGAMVLFLLVVGMTWEDVLPLVLLLAIPFALATVVPFGRFRRLLVGLGAGMIAVPAAGLAWGALFVALLAGTLAGILAVLGAVYVGYRLAR